MLIHLLTSRPDLRTALADYEANRMPHYDTVHKLALEVEHAANAVEYAARYATFSHWMLNEGRAESLV